MTIIGDAYVDVKARTDGFESGAESLFGGFGAKAALAFATAFAAAGAVTKVLYDIGASFDSAFDTMRVGTGKTGAELKDLEASFKRVASRVPESFDAVAGTLTTLTQKLGLTGKPLEELGQQFLDLSHITRTDVAANVKTVTDLFNNFGVAAKDQGPKLDELFRATQQSGLGITDLSAQMAGAGVQLRALGFNFDESTALIAGLAKQGLSASDVMPALAKTMAAAAKSGKDASTVFRDLVTSIKNAPDATAAAAIAYDALGARAGPRLAGLIREGKLSFEDLQKSIAGGSDTIAKATTDTADFSEKFAIFKNKVLIGLEPIATKVFDALGDGMDRLGAFWKEDGPQITAAVQDFGAQLSAAFAVALPVIQEMVGWVEDHLTPILIGLGAAAVLAAGPVLGLAAAAAYAYTQFDGFREAVGKVADWLTNVAAPAVAAFGGYIVSSLGDAVAWVQQYWPQISEAIGHVMTVVQTVIREAVAYIKFIWDAWGDDLLHGVEAAWAFIRSTIEAAVKVVQGVIQTVLAVINGDWGKAWDGIKQILAGVWDSIVASVHFAIDTIRAIFGGIGSTLGALWSKAWDGLKALLIAAWNGMVDWIKGGGLMSLAAFFLGLPSKVAGWFTDLIKKMLDLGGQIISGLVRGVVDKAKDFKNAILNTLSDAWDAATGWLETGSPSKKYARLGVNVVEGFINGLKSKSADVRAYMAAMLNNAISGANVAVSAIRATWGARDAAQGVTDATRARDDLLARQGQLPGLISKQVDLVAAERLKAAAIDPAEQLRIDRAAQTVIDKAKALKDAQDDGKHTELELKILTEELAAAQADYTDATKDAVGPTDALKKAEDDLKDLRAEQHDITDKLTQANRDLEAAELAVVDAQGQLATTSATLANSPGALDFFKQLAEQAGLTSAAVQQLISDLNGATSAVSGPTPGSTPGTRPRLRNTVTGRPAFTGPNGEGGTAGPRNVPGETSWVMPDGTRSYYVPGQNIDPGNVGALAGAAGSAPSGSTGSNAGGTWNLAAGTGPNGIRFTPGGGGLTLHEIQAALGGNSGLTVLAPVSYHSIDTKGLLEKMDIQSAVGEQVTKATRLSPVVA